jgi:hypothetical protein
VYRPVVLRVLDRALLVHRLAEYVKHPPENVISHGDGYGVARVLHVDAATEAIRGSHRHGAHDVVAEELLDLEGQLLLLVVNLEFHDKGVVGLGDVFRAETDVHDGTLDLYDGPDPAPAAFGPAVALRLLLGGLPVRAAVLCTSLFGLAHKWLLTRGQRFCPSRDLADLPRYLGLTRLVHRKR